MVKSRRRCVKVAQRSSLQRYNINASSRTIGDITRAVLSLYRSHCPPTPGQSLLTLVASHVYIYQSTHPSLSAIRWPAFNFLSCTLLRCSYVLDRWFRSVAVSIDLSTWLLKQNKSCWATVIENFELSHKIRLPAIERARAWLVMRIPGSSPATTVTVLSVFFTPYCITSLCILSYSLSTQAQASSFFNVEVSPQP